MKTFFQVPKKYLLLVSGIMWSSVGVMLISLATRWLSKLDIEFPSLVIISGVIPGVLVAVFGFAHIVRKNIRRIEDLKSPSSVFAFQELRSYILIVIMMSMGIMVRHSGLIPMILKTPGYYTIGTALSLSSIKYYQEFFRSS